MSWEEAWQEGRTGWDAGEAAPALVDHLRASGPPRPGARALVPGCGSGYDAFALAKAGYEVDGLDLAPTAAAAFRAQRAKQGVAPEQARILQADFFEFESAGYDVVWDYTFLCAIEPEMRPLWAEKMGELVAKNGQLWTLIFPVNPKNPTPSVPGDDGPPYRMHPEVVEALLKGRFLPRSIEPVERSHPGREGKEFLGLWEPVGR